jgi:hypothetical protein
VLSYLLGHHLVVELQRTLVDKIVV